MKTTLSYFIAAHFNSFHRIFGIGPPFSASIRMEAFQLTVNMQEFLHSKSQFFHRKGYWKIVLGLYKHNNQQQFS